MAMTAPPGADTPPRHVHPNLTDEFEVIAGRLEVWLDGSWRELGAGDRLVVDPGRVHTYRNRFDEPAEVRNVHRPAGSFQRYIERLGELAGSEGFTPRSPRGLLALTVLWRDHEDAMRFRRAWVRLAVRTGAALAPRVGVRVPAR
jgi:hypothetical protein